MTYTKSYTAWANSPTTTTPITAAKLQNIDDGIATLDTTIAALSAAQASGVYNVSTYGASADAFYTDGTTTGSSTTFTSATANFTSADVGKTIVILRGGDSNWQDDHTTIASINSTTSVVLTNAAGRSQSSCRFYISRAGDQTTAIQAAIDAAAAAGGGRVYLPGVGYLVTGLVMKNRVWLEGAGMRATFLHLAASSNVPVIRKDTTSQNSACFIGVRNMWVDGNRARQSNTTTTLASGYSAGGTSLSLTDASSFLDIGVVTIGTNRLFYTSKSGNTLNGVAGGREGTTDANGAGGATVTQIKAIGIHIGFQPPAASGNPTTAEFFDSHDLIENVFIKNCKGDGLQMWQNSASRVNNCVAQVCDEIGFRPAFDTSLTNCCADTCGRFGYYLGYSNTQVSNCVSFYNGAVTASDGYGYYLEGSTDLEEGTKVLAAVSAQDNQAGGIKLRNAQRCIIQGTVSSNGTSSPGTYSGLELVGTVGGAGSSKNVIDLVATERVASPSNAQQNALSIDAQCTSNQIRITHGETSGSAVGTAIKSGSDLSGGNRITINGMDGTKTVAAASSASYLADPYLATTHVISSVTGNLVMSAPANSHLGCPLGFLLTQDGTGGRTLTWDAAFSTTYANTGNTAGKKFRIRFTYSTATSKWEQQYMSQSGTAGTYWI